MADNPWMIPGGGSLEDQLLNAAWLQQQAQQRTQFRNAGGNPYDPLGLGRGIKYQPASANANIVSSLASPSAQWTRVTPRVSNAMSSSPGFSVIGDFKRATGSNDYSDQLSNRPGGGAGGAPGGMGGGGMGGMMQQLADMLAGGTPAEEKKKERPIRPTEESPSGPNYKDPRLSSGTWQGGSNLWDDDTHGGNVLGQLAARTPAPTPAAPPKIHTPPKPKSTTPSKPTTPKSTTPKKSPGRWW